MDIRNCVSFSRQGQKCVGILTLEIKSVPDFRLISEKDEEAVAHIKQMFSVILGEFSGYRADNSLSVELIWSCTPAANQPFASFINLSLVFRAVGFSEYECMSDLEKIAGGIANQLNSLKFVTAFCGIEKYRSVIGSVSGKEMFAVRRRDDLVGFDFAMFPYCYKYDSVSDFPIDLDLIVNTLINERDSVVIIQLISTGFTDGEKMYISNCMNLLGRISQGIPMPGMGFYREPRAEIPMRTYAKYYEYLNSPLLSMNILTLGARQNAMNIASRLMSTMNDVKSDHSTALESVDASAIANQLMNIYASPWLVYEALLTYNRSVMNLPIASSIYRMSSVYTPAEASQIFRLPIGTKRVTAGINIHEVEKRNKKFAEGIINVSDLSIGRLQNVIGMTDSYIGVNLKDLTKHMLVVGTPGSGKSTFLVGLMDRLWKKHKLPFLVIEPAKNEYRALIDSIPELQVFSPGKNNVAPFVMNPFVPPRGVTIEKYKSIVKAAFSSAFEMWTPLDQLFDETLNICYSEQGWLDSSTVDDASECFSLVDFIQTYKEVVSSKGYTGEYKKQIEAAGVLRLNGMLEQNVNVFDTRYSVPVEDILNKPTVIELSNIKDMKQKSFIIAMLLNNIYAFVEANNSNDGNLKNVILLEEAHALLSGDTVATGEGANPNAAAVKLLTDMLAEIRSRGVGIVVADQSPKKVTSQVIANTNVKVMFRLVESDDKEIVKRSTVMSDLQRERLSKLRCGEALLFFDKMDEVEEIKMDDYRLNNGITTDLSDEAIKSRMVYWDTHTDILKPYRDCDFIVSCDGGCNVSTRESARIIADRIFRKYYIKVFSDISGFAEFYKRINYIIKEEVELVFKDEALAAKIGACVKVHLLRKINYNTDISISADRRIKIYKSMPGNCR